MFPFLEELSLHCAKRVTRPFTESVLVEQPLPLLGSAGSQSDKIPPASTSLCVGSVVDYFGLPTWGDFCLPYAGFFHLDSNSVYA